MSIQTQRDGRLCLACIVQAVALSLVVGLPTARAEVNLGLGVNSVHLSSDHPSIPNVSAPGLQLQFGTTSDSRHHALILTAGGGQDFDVDAVDNPQDPFYPPDTAEYGFFDIAYRYQFKPDEVAILPYISVAGGFTSINWNTYVFDQSGFGLGLGLGALFDLTDSWSFDLNLMHRRYEGSQAYDFTGDGDPARETRATHLSLTLLYRFGHRPQYIEP